MPDFIFHRSISIFTQVIAIVHSSPTLHVDAFHSGAPGKWEERESNFRDGTSVGHPPTHPNALRAEREKGVGLVICIQNNQELESSHKSPL